MKKLLSIYVTIEVRGDEKMRTDNAMQSSIKFVIAGYILSSITLNVGYFGVIQSLLGSFSLLFGLYLLRKENHVFQLSFGIEIIQLILFTLLQIISYLTPLDMPMYLMLIHFMIVCIRNLLLIYAYHSCLPSISLSIGMLCEIALIIVKLFLIGKNVDILFAVVPILLVICVTYQLYKGQKDARDYQLKCSLDSLPIGRMLVVFLVSCVAMSFATLYIGPYLSYEYIGETQKETIDAKLIDTITLSDSFVGKMYYDDENVNIYTFHYKEKLPKKYAYVEIEPPLYSYSGHLFLRQFYFGNGEKEYYYEEVQNHLDDFMFMDTNINKYRIYLNPSDDTFEFQFVYIHSRNEEDNENVFGLDEFIFSMNFYEYGKTSYSDFQQNVFQVEDRKWKH